MAMQKTPVLPEAYKLAMVDKGHKRSLLLLLFFLRCIFILCIYVLSLHVMSVYCIHKVPKGIEEGIRPSGTAARGGR